MKKGKHPGRTKTERRVLDDIGCGNLSPSMEPKVRDALLAAGLIVELEPRKIFGPGRSPIDRIAVLVRRFEMPVAVHIQWCEAFSPENPDAA